MDGSSNETPELSPDITDDELVDIVETMRRGNQIMDTENYIIQNFLEKNDPKFLARMTFVLEQASKLQLNLLAENLSQLNLGSRSSASLMSQHSRLSSLSRLSGLDKSKRLNIRTKTDLLTKERECFTIENDQFFKESTINGNFLRAELEELNLRITETKDARSLFEQSIVKDSVDPITQRIPAGKFIRYMEDWLKSADLIVEKLRLRISTYGYKLVHLKHQLKEKKELGENLHPVDLDEMEILHQEHVKTLDEKNLDLVEVKQNTGLANLNLSRHKSLMQKSMKGFSKVKLRMEASRLQYRGLQVESLKVDRELAAAKEKLKESITLIRTFSVPDLIRYVRLIEKLYFLRFNIKLWGRRNVIQKSALDSCIKSMKRIARKKEIDPAWFRIKTKRQIREELRAALKMDDDF